MTEFWAITPDPAEGYKFAFRCANREVARAIVEVCYRENSAAGYEDKGRIARKLPILNEDDSRRVAKLEVLDAIGLVKMLAKEGQPVIGRYGITFTPKYKSNSYGDSGGGAYSNC